MRSALCTRMVGAEGKWIPTYGACAWSDNGSTRARNITNGTLGGQLVPVIGVVRMFGGRNKSGKLVNAVQTITLTREAEVADWSTLDSAYVAPSARTFSCAASSRFSSSAYIYGGAGVSGNFSDLWMFDGSTRDGKWSPIEPEEERAINKTSPGARHSAGLVLSPCEKFLFLVGGIRGATSRLKFEQSPAEVSGGSPGSPAGVGGTDRRGTVHMFDLDTHRWHLLSSEETLRDVRVQRIVAARYKESACQGGRPDGAPDGPLVVLRVCLGGVSTNPLVEVVVSVNSRSWCAVRPCVATLAEHEVPAAQQLIQSSRIGCAVVEDRGRFALLGGCQELTTPNALSRQPSVVVRTTTGSQSVIGPTSRPSALAAGDGSVPERTRESDVDLARDQIATLFGQSMYANAVVLSSAGDFVYFGGQSIVDHLPTQAVYVVFGSQFWAALSTEKTGGPSSGSLESDDDGCDPVLSAVYVARRRSTAQQIKKVPGRTAQATTVVSRLHNKKNMWSIPPLDSYLTTCLEKLRVNEKHAVASCAEEIFAMPEVVAILSEHSKFDREKVQQALARSRMKTVHEMYDDLCGALHDSAFRSAIVVDDHIVDQETAFNLAPAATAMQRQHRWFHPPVVTRATASALRDVRPKQTLADQRAEKATSFIRAPPTLLSPSRPPEVFRIGSRGYASVDERLREAQERRQVLHAQEGAGRGAGRRPASARRHVVSNKWNDAKAFVSPYARMNLNL